MQLPQDSFHSHPFFVATLLCAASVTPKGVRKVHPDVLAEEAVEMRNVNVKKALENRQ